jgi:UDP-N-acetylmuramyl tripeptide synthase
MKLLAIWLGKLALILTRVFHFGSGTTFPGLLAERIDRDIIKKLSSRLNGGAVIVTGTNGKTTTAKMLVEILSEEGYTVLHNPSGSNLTRGIASALIQSTNIFGTRLQADIAVFEIDEATMPEATTKIRPTVVLVTNLFRDQLDRYGELDKTAAIIGSSLRGFADLKLILNADDPLVSSLASYSDGETLYFGLNSNEISTTSKAAMDSKDCLACGHELEYSNRYFGHLGNWKCPNCGIARPKPTFVAEKIVLSPENVSFDAAMGQETLPIKMTIPGLYNVYNALSAAATAEVVGAKGPAISQALRNFSAAFGRMEVLDIADKKAMVLLVKNPTGANQALAAVLSDDKPKKILFALNDNFADGTDVSWIWDIDFECFNLSKVQFVVSGIRAEDIALRLKYAGINEEQIISEKDPVAATEKTAELADSKEMFFVFPTYTAMMEIRNHFAPKNDQLAELGKVTKHGV